MSIAARNAMLAGGDISAKSYVQDGLIAMWDGIENAGWGAHDANATTWVDLSGNGYDFTISTATFNSDSINVSERSATLIKEIPLGSIGTMEVSVERELGYCVVFFNKRNRIIRGIDRMQFNPDISSSTVILNGAKTFSATLNTSNGNLINGYADGQSVPISNWTDWYLGENNKLTPQYQLYSFSGKIKFIRIYSRALSAAEIAANYAVDAARFNLT